MGGKGSGGHGGVKQKPPGANREALRNALAGYKLPRVDTKDPQAIAERIESYINYCMENDLAPGVAMCANWLGIAPGTLTDWYAGRKGTPEHQRVAARFYGITQSVWEQDMHEGNINPVSGIFYGKAFYGYKDTQEIVVQHTSTEQLSVADLIAEAKRLPGAETPELTDSSNSSSTIDADFTVIDTPQKAERELTERDIENDPRYERAVKRYEKIAERKAAVEAYAPIKKENKRKYLKGYYAENKENYNPSRNTPEGRAKYNEYMKEYQRRKKAEKKAAQLAAEKAAKKAERDAKRAQKAQKAAERNSDQPVPPTT